MTPYYAARGVTLYEGDARDVLRYLPADTVDSIVTDPPFKLGQEYSTVTDADNLASVASLGAVAGEMMRVSKPGALAAVFYDSRILPFALDAMNRAGWKYVRNLTLYRRWGAASKLLGWMSTSDFVLIYTKPGAKFAFHAADTRHDVYVRSGPEPNDWGHPAQKPLDCVQHIVENLTPIGGLVLDPYAGSGTVLEAAARSGRHVVGVELERKFCDVIVARVSGYSQLPLDAETGDSANGEAAA